MPTRIYTKSSGTVGVTPTTWVFANQINPVTVPGTLTLNTGDAMTSKTEATSTTSPNVRAMGRTVIGPLGAQTISGTVKGQMRGSENNAGANATLALAIKLVQPNGSDRGVLLAQTASDSATAGNELVLTTLTNAQFKDAAESASLTLTSQTAQEGDYLVIEWGFRSATTTSRNITLSYGNDSATPLPEDTTTTAANTPWWEFSQTLSFNTTRTGAGAISATSSRSIALQADLVLPSTTHRLGSEHLLVQVYDTASPRAVVLPGKVLIKPASQDVLLGFGQPQSGTLVLATSTPGYVGTFSDQTSLSLSQATHGLGTSTLLVQLRDSSGLVLLPDTVTIGAAPTHTVSVTFGQAQSGSIVLVPASYAHVFATPTTTVNIAQIVHGLSTAELVLQVYDAGTPMQLIEAGRLTVDTSTLQVAVAFRQNQAGTVLLYAAAQRVALPFTAAALTDLALAARGGVSVGHTRQVSAARAGTGTVQAATSRSTSSVRTGSAGMQASTVRVVSASALGAASIQASTTRVVSASRTGSAQVQGTGLPSTSAQRSGSAGVQAVSLRLASSVRQALATTQATWSAAQSASGSGSGTLVAATSRSTSSLRAGSATVLAGAMRVASSLRSGAGQAQAVSTRVASSLRQALATTQALHARLASSVRSGSAQTQAQALSTATGGTTPYAKTFTNTQTVTISEAEHGFTHANLLVQVYDNGSPVRQRLVPGAIAIHATSHLVTVTFRQPTSGTVLVAGSLPASTAPHAVVPFSGTASVSIPEATHGFTHANLLVYVYDNAAPHRLLDAVVSVHTSTHAVTVTLGQVMTGTVLLVGSSPQTGTPNRGIAFSSQLDLTIDASTHTLNTAFLAVQVYDAATPERQEVLPASVEVSPTTQAVRLRFAQLQSGTVVLNGVGAAVAFGTGGQQGSAVVIARPPTVRGIPFTNTQTVTIDAATHGYAHTNLLVQVYDNGSPVARQIEPGSVTIDTSTRLVTVSFLENQSGRVVLCGAPAAQPNPNTFVPFTATDTITVFGTQHGFPTSDLLVFVYDNQSTAHLIPATVEVHQTTRDVTVRLAQAQSGHVLVIGAATSSPTSNLGHTFSNEQLYVLQGNVHGYQTRAIGVQVYDAGSPVCRRLAPASLTIHPTNYDLTVRFLEPQSGTLVLTATTLLSSAIPGSATVQALPQTVTSSLGSGTAQMQASVGLTVLPPTNRAFAFGPTLSVTIDASQHGFQHPNLLVRLYDTSTPRREFAPDLLTVHPTTYAVTASFVEAQSGLIVINGTRAQLATQQDYTHVFSGAPSVAIPQTTHQLDTEHLLVEVYTGTTTLQRVAPGSVTVSQNAGSHDVTLTFLEPQSGRAVICGYGALGHPANFGQTFPALMTWQVTGGAHGLGTTSLLVEAYDTSVPARRLRPSTLQIDAATATVTLTWPVAQAGRLVLHGSQPLTMTGFATVESQLTALLTSSLRVGTASMAALSSRRASSLRSAGGGWQVAALARVLTALRTGTGQEQASRSAILSSIRQATAQLQTTLLFQVSRSASAQMQALSLRLGSALALGQGQMQATSQSQTHALRVLSVALQGVSQRLASSVRTGSAAEQAQAQRLASSVRQTLARLAALSTRTVPTNSRAVGPVRAQAVAARVGSSLRSGTAQMQAQSVRIAHAFLTRPVLVQAFGLRVASSLRSGTGTMGAQTARAASIPAHAQMTSQQVLLASSILAAPALVEAVAGAIASSLQAEAVSLAGLASVHQQAQLIQRSAQMQALALRVASSVLSKPSVIQAFTTIVQHAVRQGLATMDANGSGRGLSSQVANSAQVRGQAQPITGLQGLARVHTDVSRFVAGVLQRPAIVQSLAQVLNQGLLQRQGHAQSLALVLSADMVHELAQTQTALLLRLSAADASQGQAQSLVLLEASSVVDVVALVQTSLQMQAQPRKHLQSPLLVTILPSRTSVG